MSRVHFEPASASRFCSALVPALIRKHVHCPERAADYPIRLHFIDHTFIAHPVAAGEFDKGDVPPNRDGLDFRMNKTYDKQKALQQKPRHAGRSPCASPGFFDQEPWNPAVCLCVVIEASIEEVAVAEAEDVLQSLFVTLDTDLYVDEARAVVIPVVRDRIAWLSHELRRHSAAKAVGHNKSDLLQVSSTMKIMNGSA